MVLTAQSRLPLARRVCLVVAAQLMTHPLVWYAFPAIPSLPRFTTLVLSEFWAFLAEGAFYALVEVAPSRLAAFGISALANGASLGLGFLIL